MENYDSAEFLAKGTYGEVYKVRDRRTNEYVAMKKIKIEETRGIAYHTLREISILKKLLPHPNIVELHDVIQHNGRYVLMFELIDMDMLELLNKITVPLEQARVHSYTLQMLTGLAFCHSSTVMHRDLKPQNILISHDGTLKLADFGLARTFVPPMRPFSKEVVTANYRPPELLLGVQTYSLALDTWAVGAIIAEMVTRRPLFPGLSEVGILFEIFRVVGTPSEQTWPGCTSLPHWNLDFPKWEVGTLRAKLAPHLCAQGVELVVGLLTLNPEHRLSAKAALQHPYLLATEEEAA